MTAGKISVGIQAFVPEDHAALAGYFEVLPKASLEISVEQYCEMEDDKPTQLFRRAQPEVVMVDMRDERAAIKALHILHSIFPGTWLIACSDSNDAGLIIEAMKMGAREYLLKPISAANLSETLSRYAKARKRFAQGADFRGKIYAVTAAMGGAGASSVAVNLAAVLAETNGPEVALIDMETPLGDVASYLGMESQFSFSDALDAIDRSDSVFLNTFMAVKYGVSVLAGPKQFKAKQTPMKEAVEKLLNVASRSFTHTLIDLPSSPDSELLRAVAKNSESMLVVLTPELPSLWRAYRLIADLRTMGYGERVRLVLNRDCSNSEINAREIQRFLKQPVYCCLPNDYKNSIQAISSGKPVVLTNHSRLASSYKRFAQKLTGIQVAKGRLDYLPEIFEQRRLNLLRLA